MTVRPTSTKIPEDILALSHERDELRKRGKYAQADALKQQIEEAGYGIKDNPRGAHLIILPTVEIDDTVYRMTRQVPSLLDEADTCLFSVQIMACDAAAQTQRCIESILRFGSAVDLEILLVNNGSQDELPIWARALESRESRLHVLTLSRPVGEAEARNVALKRSRGTYILVLNSALELTGDLFTPLIQALEDSSVGVAGWHGLHTDDLRHFERSAEREVEAVDGECMAFRRKLLKRTGLLDERFRFPYYLDIDFNFAVRDCGKRAVALPDLPLRSHPPSGESRLSDAERARLTKRNFYRFLEKWGHREDLLLDDEEE